ncbi:anti-sigma factor family protein [Pontibacter silvestris]|uniref:Anti-sigma factor family protein n=1 Tax=Pontibacter silvestris TaxID=2305183 RepID=A0ABW4WZ06_9BACT|nr:zf-HC2 domain-containing protein [Pontibacter silvestris]MCC9137623.1 zf-HC2 domain-containing protein [Pontibacter silvestris]
MEAKFTEAYQKVAEEGKETDCEKVAKLLNSMVDDEASAEEQTFFNSHIEECVSCFESHQKQKLLKGLVSGHLKRVIVPESLVLAIKARIQ